MKRNSLLLVNSGHKTKPWWVFLSVLLLVIIPFIIVWALVGEFNALDYHWLIARGQSVWHGNCNGNLEYAASIAAKYQIFYNGELYEYLKDHLNDNISITSYWTFFDPLILAPLFGLLGSSLIYPIIFNATKVSGLDVLPFSFGSGIFMTVLILSGLIPVWSQSGEMLVLYFLVRIAIAFLLTFIFFMITNIFVNKWLSTRSYSADIYFGYKSIDKANAPAKSILKKNVDIFKKQKDEEKSYVDLPKEE